MGNKYTELRSQLAEQGFSESEIDDLVLESLSAFGIVNINIQGDVLKRVSDETKAKALEKLMT